MNVAALFARRDSVYKSLPGVDAYDEDRDARTFADDRPVVAHPPCRGWGRMRQFSMATESERDLARWAVSVVRRNGGVLEHPASSSLFLDMRLPRPGEFPDEFGGWTLEVCQFHWGHRAEKRTWLYIVGSSRTPAMPFRSGTPTHCIRPTRSYPRLPSVSKPEREHTPVAFAVWLVDLARVCSVRLLESQQ